MNEEKIGIITLNGYRNYGNILQNLALQKALDKLNIASETIWYERGDHTTFVSKVSTHIRDRDLLKSLNYQFKIRFSRKYKTLEKSLMKRELNFKVFCQQNVTYSPFELNDNVLKDKKKINAVDRAYHSFLVGSDQVWGLSGESFPEVFFLPFTEKWKRNSFAASFGFSTIPQKKMIHRYKEALLAMNKISVREYEGADIVKSLTNRLPFVHLDPTFLLNRNDWDDIALQSTIHSHSKDYILTYFLGCKSQVWSDGINELALKDHLEIINLNDVNQQNFFSISPADFVNLFRSAKYVVTDSFHGAALSIIFKRRFIIADREDRMLNMNSRILTLLDRMDLTERFMVDVTVENILNTFANKINFKIANEVIKSNLVESNQYLSKLL